MHAQDGDSAAISPPDKDRNDRVLEETSGPGSAIGVPARGRRIADLPADLVRRLSSGDCETTTWTEWMGVDTAMLAVTVSRELPAGPVATNLVAVAASLGGLGILDRLLRVGRAVSAGVADFSDPSFEHIARHRSDAVRQWGVYAVNDPSRRSVSLSERLALTLPYAADPHMSVRECAWMTFRPYLLAALEDGLELLTAVARSPDPKVRRFAVEVSRPRSVWGKHCETLKTRPELGRLLLDQLKGETSRYVQLAVGNWLNDASKTRPDWVAALCADWSRECDKGTDSMVKRGLRTLRLRSALNQERDAQATFEQFSTNNPGGG